VEGTAAGVNDDDDDVDYDGVIYIYHAGMIKLIV
jgi:hypothetical protein